MPPCPGSGGEDEDPRCGQWRADGCWAVSEALRARAEEAAAALNAPCLEHVQAAVRADFHEFRRALRGRDPSGSTFLGQLPVVLLARGTRLLRRLELNDIS